MVDGKEQRLILGGGDDPTVVVVDAQRVGTVVAIVHHTDDFARQCLGCFAVWAVVAVTYHAHGLPWSEHGYSFHVGAYPTFNHTG